MSKEKEKRSHWFPSSWLSLLPLRSAINAVLPFFFFFLHIPLWAASFCMSAVRGWRGIYSPKRIGLQSFRLLLAVHASEPLFFSHVCLDHFSTLTLMLFTSSYLLSEHLKKWTKSFTCIVSIHVYTLTHSHPILPYLICDWLEYGLFCCTNCALNDFFFMFTTPKT